MKRPCSPSAGWLALPLRCVMSLQRLAATSIANTQAWDCEVAGKGGRASNCLSPHLPLSSSACLAAGPQVNAGASGCIATVVYALWGNWSRSWGMSNEVLRKNTLFTFWDVAVAALNGLIFFFTGAAATNFTIRRV